MLLPLALIDKAIGSRVLVLLRDEHELWGTLTGFDEYLNLILEDTLELKWLPQPPNSKQLVQTSPQNILVNGNNIVMIVPCGQPPEPALFQDIGSAPPR